MNVTIFLFTLTVCAAVTSLLTEGIKNFLDGLGVAYVSNLLVLTVALVVGCGTTALYYAAYEIPPTALNMAYILLMGVANWLGATLGYDKVRQTVAQIVAKGKGADRHE